MCLSAACVGRPWCALRRDARASVALIPGPSTSRCRDVWETPPGKLDVDEVAPGELAEPIPRLGWRDAGLLAQTHFAAAASSMRTYGFSLRRQLYPKLHASGVARESALTSRGRVRLSARGQNVERHKGFPKRSMTAQESSTLTAMSFPLGFVTFRSRRCSSLSLCF